MTPTEQAWRIGALEERLTSAVSRVASLEDRVWRLAMQLLKDGNGQRERRRQPWVQYAAMGMVGLSSLLGIISPERAASIIRALLH